jgi:zinc protease
LSFHIDGSPADLPIGLQLVYAIITDGKLEQSAVDEWQKSELQALKTKKTVAQVQMADAVSATFFGGDIRLAPLTEEIIDRQRRDAGETWFKRIADGAVIEVAVVGDIDSDRAIDLIAKTIGAFPKRTGSFDELSSLRKLNRSAGPFIKTVHLRSVTPKALVLSGFVGCDELDADRRPLSLASLILTDRMIQLIRMQERLVYGIRCQSVPGKVSVVSACSWRPPRQIHRMPTSSLT